MWVTTLRHLVCVIVIYELNTFGFNLFSLRVVEDICSYRPSPPRSPLLSSPIRTLSALNATLQLIAASGADTVQAGAEGRGRSSGAVFGLRPAAGPTRSRHE